MANRSKPDDPLAFIQRCVAERRVLWTYHVNMRMAKRLISRRVIVDCLGRYEIIESYPEDKYMPSYLVYFTHEGEVYHALFAVDAERDEVRVVTAYRPSLEQWNEDFRTRKLV